IDPWFLDQLAQVMELQGSLFDDKQDHSGIVEIINIEQNKFFTDRKSAITWARENLQRKSFYNKHIGADIYVGRRGIKKCLGESAIKIKTDRSVHLSSISVLSKILEEMILCETHQDRNDDPHIISILRFVAAVSYEDSVFGVKITVKAILSEPNRFYTYEISEIEEMPGVIYYAESMNDPTQRPPNISLDILLQTYKKNNNNIAILDAAQIRTAKEFGLSDRRLAFLTDSTENEVREFRKTLGIKPVYKRVDTCGAEFESFTPYLYSTYEEECEAEPTERRKIMILGSGPNRIGQGIEFDYCCCHASFALRDADFETIMVNCNPETVSTDYDTSDRLYFEPLTFEDVMNIVDVEKPEGVIVQFGGQTPLNLADRLHAAGVPIIGTSPDSIDLAEDRKRFSALLQELNIPQPPNGTAVSPDEAKVIASEIGYPVVVRPSFVLGGRAMAIVYDEADLDEYMRSAVDASPEKPILIDKFLERAAEIDVDALADKTAVVIAG
ncbi:MAG: hypothetical protein ACRD6X_22030, partial [Pyrinomonadaceae bacterium]